MYWEQPTISRMYNCLLSNWLNSVFHGFEWKKNVYENPYSVNKTINSFNLTENGLNILSIPTIVNCYSCKVVCPTIQGSTWWIITKPRCYKAKKKENRLLRVPSNRHFALFLWMVWSSTKKSSGKLSYHCKRQTDKRLGHLNSIYIPSKFFKNACHLEKYWEKFSFNN